MKYIHVRNLERYQPGYKDRDHIWAKIHYRMLIDPDTQMLGEVSFSRLVKLIVLETYLKKPILASEKYLSKINFDFGLQCLEETLSELTQFIEIIDVTEENFSCVTEKRREEKKREEEIRESPADLFNLFKTTISTLPLPSELTKDRAVKCRLRLKERPLAQWRVIFEKMNASDFLRGENDRAWKASFDWIISNETNGAKVLEGKYDKREVSNAEKSGIEKLRELRAKGVS